MKRLQKVLLTLIFLVITVHGKADSWIDPSWKEMLDSSDVVALVEYTAKGDFRAPAKIITLYKGQLKPGDEIWISGFSNRYGPIDKMRKGDTYLVFLSLNVPTDDRLDYWDKEATKDRHLNDFVEAYKNRKAYYVWSPTSGDLKVGRRKVQYDLVQTSFYEKQAYFSLPDFEQFLRTY